MSASDVKPKASHVLVGIVTILTAMGSALSGIYFINKLPSEWVSLCLPIGLIPIGNAIIAFFLGTRLIKRGEKYVLGACILVSILAWFLIAFLEFVKFIIKFFLALSSDIQI